MFEGQPKGLYALALANTGERFGYYTMLAVFALFLRENFGLSAAVAGGIYSGFLAFVYLLPFPGGIIADRVGYGKCVTLGILIMFLGYLVLAIPAGSGTVGLVTMFAALVLVCLGTGLFKGNLQVMVGNLYEEAKYADKRDSGFSLFYMFINIGAMFAATAAIMIMQWAQDELGWSKSDSYHCAFGVACLSLIVSIAIYYSTKKWFAHADYKNKPAKDGEAPVQAISKEETNERMICLGLVFAVCTFFWMAFHQNGATLTFFAESYVVEKVFGTSTMLYNVVNLVIAIFGVYGLFGLFQSKTTKGRSIALAVLAAVACAFYYMYNTHPAEYAINAPIFQQFNPCFVVMLTPVSVAVFGWLGKKGKEPKSPVKIGLGMLVAALGFVIMLVYSLGLATPDVQEAAIANGEEVTRITANSLISVYFVLTVAELLLSPVGISFVSKVAPPQYKGAMMGCWFISTFAGNFLVSIPCMLWGGCDLTVVWGVLVFICLLSAAFIFSIIKKLNKVA